jgi:hypothetical protein
MTTNAVPALSRKNVLFIEELIKQNKIQLIIEYGSGNSTLYFLEKLKAAPSLKFTSVENTKSWFYKNIKAISKNFSPSRPVLVRKYWEAERYKEFYKASFEPYTPIQEGASRVERWKRAMELGPFFRFERPKSRLYEIIAKPVFKISNKFLRQFSKFKNERSSWKCRINKVDFSYQLVPPSMKDQFGESPNRDEFIQAGLEQVSQDSKNILVMIDAGPRHYIIDKIIETLPNKNLHICLFDAQRPEYESVLSKYSGEFFSGETELIDGTDFYSSIYPDNDLKASMLSKELWYKQITGD